MGWFENVMKKSEIESVKSDIRYKHDMLETFKGNPGLESKYKAKIAEAEAQLLAKTIEYENMKRK